MYVHALVPLFENRHSQATALNCNLWVVDANACVWAPWTFYHKYPLILSAQFLYTHQLAEAMCSSNSEGNTINRLALIIDITGGGVVPFTVSSKSAIVLTEAK